MSSSSLVYEPPVTAESVVAERTEPLAAGARLADYLELTKPKIAVLELVTVAVAGCVARFHAVDAVRLFHALIGTALVAGSASAANQWLERNRDRLMPRTSNRPLPSGRLGVNEVWWLAAISGLAGVVYLALLVNGLTAWLGLASWVLYVLIYTPLKTRTTLNTLVGAVAGAVPILMGWAAADGEMGLAAATLFMIVFLWQFPHFMAIAWLYRHEYRAAGMQMLTVVEPSGRAAGVQAVAAALLLLPVSLLPAVVHFAGGIYCVVALLVGVGQLVCAWQFLRLPDEIRARRLLRASLVYLPVLLVVMMFGMFEQQHTVVACWQAVVAAW